jgi:PAS domain S-box-containing protein
MSRPDQPATSRVDAAADPAGQLFRAGIAEPVVAAFREKILYALAIVATLGLTPFALNNFRLGYPLIGALAMTVVAVFVVDAVAIYRGRRPPIPVAVAFVAMLVALVVAIHERGLLGIFWTFPAILLLHFVLERRYANLFNLTLVVVVGALSWRVLEQDVTLRILVAQLLTIAFTNIFSYIVEAEQRKESEQGRRLGLLVRATRAGFYQWERETGTATYSGRLKEMIGYPPDTDTSTWPPVEHFMHPEDREKYLPAMRAALRDRSTRNGIRRHAIEELRIVRADGGVVWVHTEGLFMHGPDGRVIRFVASLLDVTERHEKEEALRASIRVREEVERIARHDIKTPLNSIVAVPRLLREGRRLDAREEELLAMVEGAAYRVLDMVNLSVDIYRMEQGEYRFSPRVVDLVALLQTVTRDVRAHAETKGVRIEVRVDGEPPGADRRAFAWAEELLCYSVLANLLKNAVEASPDGGVVSVAFATGGPQTAMSLHNAGVVPESVRGRFFEKYATYGKVGGFGLGTYSARLMARVQQGELEMRTSEAEGTVLELRLPSLPPGASPALPGARTGGRPEAAAAARPLPALRVLVADDDEFNVAFVRSGLPSPPLAVATAINGRAAVEAARAAPFDVVFLDLEMPVMNGFEALARIRALEAQAGRRPAAVIAFSSFDDDAIRRRCAEAGFDAYLSKPAPRERLHEILHAVADGRPLPGQSAPAGGEGPGADDPVDVDPDLAGALPRFLETRRAMAAELAQAVAAGERPRIAALAHKLAGSLALYGFAWAAAACRDLQREATAAPVERLAESCEALRRHLDQVRLRGLP